MPRILQLWTGACLSLLVFSPAFADKTRNVITQSQIAATIAALVGEDFRAYQPAAAPSLLEAMGGPKL